MIEHLRESHKVGKQGPIQVQLEKGQIQIEAAFGNTRPQIIFNQEVFRNMLLHWIIQNNISFRAVELASFRVLLGYLAACVSISDLNFHRSKMTNLTEHV